MPPSPTAILIDSSLQSKTDTSRRAQFLAVVVLTLVAAGLRMFRLTRWPLEGDELYTLRDSLLGGWPAGAKKQLLFFLNDLLVAPWTALDEVGLRLLPFMFGVAAIPVLFVLGRRAFGPRAAVLSCALLTFSPWHIYWSQNARYYTLSFLLSMTFALAVFVGARDKKLNWTLIGLVAGVLAILSHPSSGVVVAGCGVWVGGYHVHQWIQSRSDGSRRGIGALIAVGAIGAVVIGVLFRQLLSWRAYGEAWGHQGLPLLLSYGNWIGMGVGLFGLAGIFWMWTEGQKAQVCFMASWWVLPSLVFALLSYFMSVSVSYLFVTAPGVIVLAGWATARMVEAMSEVSHRTIATTTIMATLILAPAPSLVSHYIDGGRPDFRAAAEFIEARAENLDMVLGDQDGALDHYLTSRSAEAFALNAQRLEEQAVEVAVRGGKQVWLAVHLQGRGGFNERSLSGAEGWILNRCELETTIGRPRVDFKSDYVQVYRCPVATLDEPGP